MTITTAAPSDVIGGVMLCDVVLSRFLDLVRCDDVMSSHLN